MTSAFDPNVFMAATLTEANTRRPPIPAGTVLRGTIGEPKITTAEGKKETNLGQIYHFLEVPVELDLTANPSVRAQIGQDKVTLSWKTRLDIAPSGQGFDMTPGKNNGLRQLREALDMNKPGDSFSLLAVTGRQVLCTIKNEPYQGEVYDNIGSLARLA